MRAGSGWTDKRCRPAALRGAPQRRETAVWALPGWWTA